MGSNDTGRKPWTCSLAYHSLADNPGGSTTPVTAAACDSVCQQCRDCQTARECLGSLGQLAIRLQAPGEQHQGSSRGQPQPQHSVESGHSGHHPQPRVAGQGCLYQRRGVASQDGFGA